MPLFGLLPVLCSVLLMAIDPVAPAQMPARRRPPAAAAAMGVDRTVDVLGHRLHYVEAGHGPAVVLLHGLGADVHTWRLVMPRLSASFHVYALDQLGAGDSEKPEGVYRVSTLVDTTAAFMTAVGLPRASIVGHSLGGWTAALLAATHPDRVDKLVLADAAGYGVDPSAIVHSYLTDLDPNTAAMAERFLGSPDPNSQRLAQTVVGTYFTRRLNRDDGYALAALVGSMMRGEDVLTRASVGAITAPTLVLWGAADDVIPPTAGDAYARDIPNAEHVVLDGCGHRTQLQCAAEFNRAVARFLTAD